MQMQVERNALDSGESLFSVAGKIDTNTSRELEQMLLEYIEGEKKSFRVDLSGVTYVSSAGLRVFLSAQKKSAATGITMTVTGVSKQIQEIFDITGFSGVLNIE